MSRPTFSSEGSRLLVGDASMWISLTSTGAAEAHLRALDCRAAITDVALMELERGRAKGRVSADAVMSLLQNGVIEKVSLAPDDEFLFLSLISGSASETLDDGEAATLAWASARGALAIIDERKGILVAAKAAPQVTVISTVDLILSPEVVAATGKAAVADALYSALVGSLMRVPRHRLEEVVALLGPARVQDCRSLPAAIRNRSPLGTQGIDAGF